MGNLTAELNEIMQKQERVLAIATQDLFNELVSKTPVDTGYLKGGWEKEKTADGWLISNPTQYASYVMEIYINENGVLKGNKENPMGINPIIAYHNRKLQEELNKI